MTGAENLKPGILHGDILLNLDSEDEYELCIGCAGGLDVSADFKYKNVKATAAYKAYRIDVKGLQGGHSGMDISLYRGNANKIIAHSILAPMEKYGVQLASFNGGSLRNAIPFEAGAVILVPVEKTAAVLRSIRRHFANTKAVYAQSDPSTELSIAPCARPANYIETKVALNAVKAIIACPSNVIRMSRSMEGLTETSINLAIVRTGMGHLKVASLMRSAIDFSKAELADRVRVIFEMAGAKVKFSGGYSGWVPKPDTPVIKLLTDTYRKLFNEDMNVLATHGGLECALLGAKYPNWEMVSIGPTIMYPHSPDERTYIPSVQKAWDFLKAVLEEIPVKYCLLKIIK